jgi:hypothetical protein
MKKVRLTILGLVILLGLNSLNAGNKGRTDHIGSWQTVEDGDTFRLILYPNTKVEISLPIQLIGYDQMELIYDVNFDSVPNRLTLFAKLGNSKIAVLKSIFDIKADTMHLCIGDDYPQTMEGVNYRKLYRLK